MRKQIHLLFIIFLLLILFEEATGQQTNMPAITKQIWLDFNPQYNINPKLIGYGDVDVRTVFPQYWYQFITRGGIAYKRRLFFDKNAEEEFHAGIGFFYTLNFDKPDRLEIRPYQGYKLTWPHFARFTLQNYVRLEERFQFTGDGGGDDFGLRLRYQVTGTFHCTHCDNSFIRPFYLPFSAEFFFNLNGTQQFNDLIRVGPGLGYLFPSGWRPEFDLTFNRTRATVDEKFTTSDLVFRFRLFYKIPDKKNKQEKNSAAPNT
jgi:Protein of unknown function (DUF2490)